MTACPLISFLKDHNEKRYSAEFQELQLRGSGHFSSVFEVLNKLDDNTYAIKKIPLSFAKLKQNLNKTLEKVLREVKLLARISHPNIIRYYNCWVEIKEITPSTILISEDYTTSDFINETSFTSDKNEKDGSFEILWDSSVRDECFEASQDIMQKKYARSFNINDSNEALENSEISIFIQMELCNETLEDYLLRRNASLFECKKRSAENYLMARKSCLREAKKLFHQIIAGLMYIHNVCYMVHRDLKPSNIFINKNMVAKLGDFGLAKQLQPFMVTPASFSQDGKTKMATRLQSDDILYDIRPDIYASPEQNKTHSIFDERADIYSLGLIALRLFHPMATLMEFFQVVKDLKENKSIADEKKELSDILIKMISEKPTDRPSLKEIREVFDQILNQENLDCEILGMSKVKYEGSSSFVEKYLKIIQKKLYVFAGKDQKKAEKVFNLEDCNIRIDAKKEAVIIEHPFQLGCIVMKNERSAEETLKSFLEPFGERQELTNFCFLSERR